MIKYTGSLCGLGREHGEKQMNKKYSLISILCGTSGIIGGVLMIVAAFMEDTFPRPLRFVAAICMFLNAMGIALNYRYIRSQEKADTPKESK